MVHYKLIYFNLAGRAELSRLILHHQGIPFEDFRIPYEGYHLERKEWLKYKDGKSKS